MQYISCPIFQEVKTIRQWNMVNITWETKCGGETIPRPFSKKLKLSRPLDQQSKDLYSLFVSYAKLRTIEIHWN